MVKISKPEAYSLCQIFKMEFFYKILKLEAYSLCQISKLEVFFAKIINSLELSLFSQTASSQLIVRVLNTPLKTTTPDEFENWVLTS